VNGAVSTVMERDNRTVPRLPERVLTRPRLIERFAEWAPITVVRGAQGYGKTTAVAGWLGAQPENEAAVVWLTMTDLLAEHSRFLAMLRQALLLTGLLPEGEPAPPDTAAIVAEALSVLPFGQRMVLVIDNAHRLTDMTIVNDLNSLAQRHAELHVVVISRARHPIEAAAMGMAAVNVIRPRELALTEAEIRDLAAVLGLEVDERAAAEVHHAVGGWVAVVRSVLQASSDGQPPLAAAREYIRDSVLPAASDDATVEQVMRLSLADEMDLGLIRALGEDGDDDLIRRIEASGLAERRYRGEQELLVLPALIREVLREAFSHRDPAAAAAFHRRVASWYAEQPEREAQLTALEHAVAGQDWTLAHRIWAVSGEWISLWELDRCRFALAAIPEDVMVRFPGMHVARFVMDATAGDNDTDARNATVRTYFEASSREVDDDRARLPLADLLYVGTGHLIGLRMNGDAHAAAEFGSQIEQRIGELTTTGHELHDRLGSYYLQRGITETVLDLDESAIRFYQRAWEYRTGANAEHVPATVAANLAMTYALRGQARQAELWVSRYQSYDLRGTWAEYVVSIGARIAAGLMRVDQLDEQGAAALLELLGDGSSASELWPFSAMVHARHGLHFADPATALADLDSRQAEHEPPAVQGAASRVLMRARADLLIAAGYGQRAQYLLAAHPQQGPTLAVPLARIQVLSGEYANARSIAAEATAGKHVPPRDRLELLLLKAFAALRMGDRTDAAVLMRHALDVFRSSKMLSAFATVPESAREDLLALSGQQLDAEDLDRLLAQPPVYPEQLTIITLTKREQSLLLALESTVSRQRIAASLYVSLNTVKTQMAGLYRKLNTATREDTLMRARQLGLLNDNPD
jgi:LuxR family maltose regulon positive regulatory protein